MDKDQVLRLARKHGYCPTHTVVDGDLDFTAIVFTPILSKHNHKALDRAFTVAGYFTIGDLDDHGKPTDDVLVVVPDTPYRGSHWSHPTPPVMPQRVFVQLLGL